ncbi:YeeE/YedE thiosulfate transporter family protein [Shewanella woodyi]|uniref:YeeE/YedE thiosulfate transporter family protein n=1 Tax=Shewanella woodyi TaxID=60961 RepID=UPI0007EBBE0B|nr:YeeE/YedE thiosulfate transporter family protein [Shewanella woodyi]
MTLFFISIVLIAALGYLAQSIGLCMVRGVNQAADGKPMFLLAILFSGVLSWISILVGYYFDIQTPFISYEFSLWALFGGFLFGFGAAVNNGCGVSTISRLARGHLAMLLTVGGWLAGWVLLTKLAPDINLVIFNLSPIWHNSMLALLSVMILFLLFSMSSYNRKVWVSMLLIGLMASIVFLTEQHWTPSALLKDISQSVWSEGKGLWPTTERFILIAALVTGMLVAALKARTFQLLPVNSSQCMKHLSAGVLMGVGAAIASGGNDTQLLLALPSFSPAGVSTVFSMLVGIYLGRKLVVLMK